jgi:L-fuculose-phosphate aldolase
MTMHNAQNEAQLRQQLTEISHRTYQRGLVRGSGGNISARLNETHMLITPSGVTLGDTTPANIIKVDLDTGEWEPNEPYIPSKETHFHAEIYRARPEVNGIVHCHPPHATAYAVCKKDIPAVTDAGFKQPPMQHVSFSPSGTKELARKVADAAQTSDELRVLMLDEHGIVAIGHDLVQAFVWADLAEEMAQIAFVSSLIASPAP